MSIEEIFYNKNLELQQKVKDEILSSKKRASSKNIFQLNTILEELEKIEKQKNITLKYPRIIIDSWDYSDNLGLELIELAKIYGKIKGYE
ncbi:hypothetical protein [Robinsoniella sp. KNHs210]|uniref:hypothetical protein n=1 Tax=Robinsoniella sp. KNHs210 TaxID=1469950 RepID=UPI0004837FBD|nr:hypothetical protein [Robinsoniella sp. KNHs210]